VLDDFKRALARVQSDYGFYIDCQANPAVALTGYDLTPDERSALTDPVKLADVISKGVGVSRLRISIVIKGKHDWINRAAVAEATSVENADRDAKSAREVDAIKRATTDQERTDAVVRLMGLIG